MIPATTNTPPPRATSVAPKTRSGRFARRPATGGGAVAAMASLAGGKHGLSGDLQLPERVLDLLHGSLGQRRVVERRRRLLSVVLGPPEEVQQRVALLLFGLVAINEQVGERRDRPRPGARGVGDG